MKFYLKTTLCLCMVVTSLGALLRQRRAGGKVDLPKRIQPPKRISKGEAVVPRPGWTHCIHSIKATNNWRMINAVGLGEILTTQFQCTWNLEVDRAGTKIQIAIQKLELGNTKDGECSKFLEIIDNGKSQGRFCRKNLPGDYFTMGPKLRIDIQGDGALSRWLREKKTPFRVAYRAVPQQQYPPGFRTSTSKPKSYDRYHTGTKHLVNWAAVGNSNTGRKGNKNKEDSSEASGALSTDQIVAISVCCGIAAVFLLAIVVWRCCCVTVKREHDKEKPEDEHASNGYTNQTYPLPGNELIIASEVVRPCRASKSTSSGHISHEGKIEKKPLDDSKERKHRNKQTRHKSRDQKKRSDSPEKRRRRDDRNDVEKRRSRNDKTKEERRHKRKDDERSRRHKKSRRQNDEKHSRNEKSKTDAPRKNPRIPQLKKTIREHRVINVIACDCDVIHGRYWKQLTEVR
uniref:Uncharacterized protein LOC100187518 n=1 Tax=Phallusia mammillata TaxID=59560 RepID=A0A6F9DJB5_9ASCI|nr:uncharacterized protein LOC100187518 [Phallusia mammillata]